MVQDALAGGNGLVVQHLAHHVRKGDGQGVRLGMSQADGKAGLGVTINKENLFSGLGQSHAEVYASCRFANAPLLVDKCHHLGVLGSHPPSKIIDSIRKNLVNGRASSPLLLGKKKGRSIAGTPPKSIADIWFLV